jgi:hypothetical protein
MKSRPEGGFVIYILDASAGMTTKWLSQEGQTT